MAHTWRLFPEHKLIFTAWEGDVNGRDIAEVADALHAQPWDTSYRHLWDGRYITELDLEVNHAFAAIGSLAKLYARLGGGRAAVILRRDAHIFGAEMLLKATRLDEKNIRIFTTLAPALEWIGASPVPADVKPLIRPE